MTELNGADYPSLVKYDQDHLRQIGLPLGGIGAGVVSLGGRGNLHDWEIVNRPAKGFDLQQTFFCLYTRSADGTKTAHALEGVIPPADYEGARGATMPNHGLPRFRQCSFEAAYPFGQVTLSDEDVPLNIKLQAFNPLIPADSDNSGIPVAILRYSLINDSDADIEAAVCGNLQNFIGADGTSGQAKDNHNSYREADGLAGILMASAGVDADAPQWGTLALTTPRPRGSQASPHPDGGTEGGVVPHPDGGTEGGVVPHPDGEDGITHRTAWANYSWGDSLLDFWDDFSEDGRLEERERDNKDDPTGSLCVSLRVPANGAASVTFFLSWHFPNRTTWKEAGVNHPQSPIQTGARIGNYYATQYADAWEAAAYTAKNLNWLEADTKAFVNGVCESDLPAVVKEAALFNLSTLRSQTVFRTPDGFMFGWEGCDDTAGCCFGSCTHVWNYEQATGFLFGDLALGMREVEFNYATRGDGGMSFRVDLPLEHAQSWSLAAADGQMGCIMKLYRDWQLSGDSEGLRRIWPNARKALEFCWLPGGWDADKDGVMEGCQHNTMDVEYYGPNPQMGIWYLGALRAMEEMARHLDDGDFAADCRRLYEQGSAWIDANLFNGDYYEHEIRPASGVDAVLGMLMSTMGAADPSEPVLQLGAGCLVDQLVGQFLAHVCGLGYLLDENNVKQTLGSIMRFNFKENMYGHFNHMRSYVLNDESALLMATYPRGDRPARPFPYYNEVMTGFEYTAAVGMLYEGDIDNGLKCISAIRDRYDGKRRNPFDEAECGHHYARAMASWAAILALTGFHFSAVDRRIRFAAPSESRQHFWSSGYAWGTCALSPTDDGGCDVAFSVAGGEISFREFALTGLGAVSFAQGRTLKKGDALQFQVSA
ncbi:MAG: GH116 family glycosyl-hydrolase [Chloroflexota bacterium]|nr:GH116 family glycosyl-hydrolase [Chloroflexota bacterium]MDE2947797.1 GH116 family glycosyl-hydrolase [Chloroflexota bacterium]